VFGVRSSRYHCALCDPEEPGPGVIGKLRVFLIQDGGSSHVAGCTQRYFAGSQGWWRPRYTPANASWLNQAEILIHAFKHYYLKRTSWKSQEEFKTHVLASWPEYNHRYAHPFEWTWTNQKMRQWFAKHTPNSLQVL
jgi:hypothetical protein